jgi:ankyrin repeat protein
LSYAASRGYTEIAKSLIAAGASLESKDKKYQMTALIYAAE